MEKLERERFDVSEEEIDDFTGDGPWEINGETYDKITKIKTHSDGECTEVIVQGKSDKKFFEFSWTYSYSQTYHYDETWREVFPEVITTTIYK